VKVLEYLLKFIFASRALYEQQNPQDASRTCAFLLSSHAVIRELN